MVRVFTKDVGNFSAGDKRDWPLQTWKQFARSVKLALHRFTATPDDLITIPGNEEGSQKGSKMK